MQSCSDSKPFFTEIVEAHNALRELYNCCPLNLNMNLCDYAQQWAEAIATLEKCDRRPDSIFGENIFVTSQADEFDGNSPVLLWFEELKNCELQHRAVPDNLLQLVWPNTTDIGIGIATRGEKVYIVVNYHPICRLQEYIQTLHNPPRRSRDLGPICFASDCFSGLDDFDKLAFEK